MITNDGATCDICGKSINPITDNIVVFKLPTKRRPSHCCNDCKPKAKELMKKETQNG